MVALGLRIASDLLGLSLPGDVLGVVCRTGRVSRLSARVHSELLREEEPGVAEDHSARPYHPFQLLERFSDWMWNGWRFAHRVLTVNTRDRRLLPLPGPLRVLYYPLRCVRLLVSHGLMPLLGRLRAETRRARME